MEELIRSGQLVDICKVNTPVGDAGLGVVAAKGKHRDLDAVPAFYVCNSLAER